MTSSHRARIPFLLLVAACSGADAGGLLGPYDGSPGVDVQVGVDAGSQDDASTTEDAQAIDGGIFFDASTKDVATYQDPGIFCGKTECDPKSDLCCGTPTSYYPQTVYSFACEPLSDLVQCAGGLPIDCDDDNDCASGEFCCATLGYNSVQKIACQKTACSTSVYQQQAHLCDPNASDCAVNTTCTPSALTGYNVCQ